MYGAVLFAGSKWASPSAPFTPFVAVGFGLFIEGIDQSGRIRVNTLNTDNEVGRRGTLSVTLTGLPSDARFVAGMDVILVALTTVLWAGTIERVTEAIPLGADVLFQSIEAVDNSGLADRRLVAEAFVAPLQTAGSIATSLVTSLLLGDGVTIGKVSAGNGVFKAVFNYTKLSTALDELAQTSGFVWYIDVLRRFNFHEAGAIPAPFPIIDVAAPVRALTVSSSREQFRSRQYLEAGKADTDPQVEDFSGDGKRRTFTLGFEVAVAPTITVNAIAKTVGIRKVDTGKDYYYVLGDKEITQDTSLPLLTTIDTLTVAYIGKFPITIDAIDASAVAARQAIEGGSGLYDEAEKNTAINDITYATEYVASLLRRFGKIPKVITFQTDQPLLQAGQMLTVTMADEQLSGEFLITSVRSTFLDGPEFFRYDVSATDGEYLGGWAEFFRQLENRGKVFSIGDNKVASIARAAYDAVSAIDSSSFVVPIDDGTGDPYTGLETDSALLNVELGFFVGRSNVAKERFDI